MNADSSLTLPGFVRPETIDAILAEIEDAPTVSNERLRTPYSWMYNLDFPPEHPRRALFRWSSQIITADAFAEDGPGCALFGCRELVEFVRRLLGYASLYPSVCPTLSVMASVLDEGDENGWHFDTNDGVVSILLQAADDGGHFDFAPYLRDESDENYQEVARLFDGQLEPVRVAQAAGMFSLFLGRRSPHRVTPVRSTAKPRIVLLLSYDQHPGMAFTADMQRSVREPSTEPFLGTAPPS